MRQRVPLEDTVELVAPPLPVADAIPLVVVARELELTVALSADGKPDEL